MAGKKERAIVIKKEEVVEGGHHGGAWKVAYADFVTAMMAFFLLMWLLNATTEQQKRGIADYFSPNPATPQGSSGAGMMFSGRTPNTEGTMASDQGAIQVAPTTTPVVTMDDEGDDPAPPIAQRHAWTGDAAQRGGADRPELQGRQVADVAPKAPGDSAAAGDKSQPAGASAARTPPVPAAPTDKDLQAELARWERAAFEGAAQQIRDAVRADPALADLARQLRVDITPEGLRVQIVDEERRPMFATGSSALNERARALLAKVAPILMRLPEAVSITGHTDATPYKGGDRTNWDLSAERANATRRLLVEAGLPEGRLRSVAGMADRDPLLPDDRTGAANRRIAITVLRDAPAAPPR